MTPDARASLADLARLRDEIAADREAMARGVDDVRDVLGAWQTAAADRAQLALAAVGLHGLYSALESIIERVGRIVDGSIPSGDTWHRDLLSQGMTEIPSVRPAIVPRELQGDLLALLEFRHFFRHAYGVDLDPAKLRYNLERAAAVAEPLNRALDDFDAFLGRAMTALKD
jgi:hypothetical protein